MLNAKQMADEIRAYRLANPGLRNAKTDALPVLESAADCRR